MFGFLKMVAWTTTAMATLLLVISVDIRGQDTASNEVREKAKTAERAVADRYEQILRSRPQIGPVLDKLYEFHTRQGSIAELCQRLELSANEGEDGNAYQLLGLLQLRRGLPDDAIANLARAELLLPNEPFASLYRSRALSLNRQFPSALEALQNAARRRPSQSIALEILKELSQFKDRGIDIDVAVALLSELEQQFTGSSQVNEKLADCFIEFGRPEAAQPVYEKLVDLTRDPLRKIELRMQLARLKKRLGQPEQSLIEFERLITQVKPHSWLHTTLIEQIEQLTEELHGSEGLIEYYEGMLQKQPDDVTSALQLARALRLRSRFDEARAWISKAIESSPSQPEPLLAMADLMEETNQFASASESFQRLVRLDPTNVDYIVRWGHLAAQEAIAEAASNSSSIAGRAVQQADAVAIWKRLLVGHELDPAKALQVAELLRSISAEDEAVALYQQAVEVSGGKVEFTELLGEYLLKIDRREEAKKVFDASYAAAGDDRETLIQLSEILRRLKFPAEALRAMEKACESKADFGDLLQLANLQTETEHIEAAINTLTRASRLAESSAELLLAWDTQTKTYKLFRQLPELLNALEKDVTASAGSMESLQQLAMAQSANSQTAEAAATALKATLLKPNSLRAWLLTARLQKEAGLSLRELESLAALCKIDTKHSADYLQRIATIHFQLNQVDARP